jgi:hypothetical protein
MKKALYFLPILALAVSCDKDEDNSSDNTKTPIITQSAWKFENAGVDIDKNGTIELDISNQLEACARDNTYKFEANGSGTVNEGATRCNSSAPQTVPFSWAFLSGETELQITSNPAQLFSGQYKIVTLNNSKMTLSKDTTVSGLNATLIANFIH